MRLVFIIAVILIQILVGCLINHSTMLEKSKDGAELKVSLNAGPVANTATIQLFLSKVSGFEAGMPVEIIIPENKIISYLSEQNKIIEIGSSKTKELTIDTLKKFIVYVRSPTKDKNNLYLLDKDGSLSLDIPYCVLQQIQLIIVVNKIELDVPLPVEKRSSAHGDINKLEYIIRINNPSAEK